MTTKWVVCPTCRGEGSHVNPAVDGNGLTADDIDELGGDDFLEDYLGGTYDIRCEECKGERVVRGCPECERPVEQGYEACWDHLANEDRDALDEEHEYQAMVAAELRAGC